MNYRLATLLTVAAAVAALPVVASAATMRHDETERTAAAYPMVSQATIMNGPNIAPGDDPATSFAKLQAYLNEVCPTVMAHPGNYSPDLASFCQQPRG